MPITILRNAFWNRFELFSIRELWLVESEELWSHGDDDWNTSKNAYGTENKRVDRIQEALLVVLTKKLFIIFICLFHIFYFILLKKDSLFFFFFSLSIFLLSGKKFIVNAQGGKNQRLALLRKRLLK